MKRRMWCSREDVKLLSNHVFFSDCEPRFNWKYRQIYFPGSKVVFETCLSDYKFLRFPTPEPMSTFPVTVEIKRVK